MPTRPICASTTLESNVVQIRERTEMTLIRRALGRPCLSPYIPWYLGISSVPEGYGASDPEAALATHFSVPASDLDCTGAAWFRHTALHAAADALYAELGDSAVNLVISDMAPNTSGVRSVDQAKSMYLVELALDFAQSRLAAGGDFLTKIFHGPGFDTLLRSLKSQFLTVQTRKPEASRARSQETYLLARGFKRQH